MVDRGESAAAKVVVLLFIAHVVGHSCYAKETKTLNTEERSLKDFSHKVVEDKSYKENSYVLEANDSDVKAVKGNELVQKAGQIYNDGEGKHRQIGIPRKPTSPFPENRDKSKVLGRNESVMNQDKYDQSYGTLEHHSNENYRTADNKDSNDSVAHSPYEMQKHQNKHSGMDHQHVKYGSKFDSPHETDTRSDGDSGALYMNKNAGDSIKVRGRVIMKEHDKQDVYRKYPKKDEFKPGHKGDDTDVAIQQSRLFTNDNEEVNKYRRRSTDRQDHVDSKISPKGSSKGGNKETVVGLKTHDNSTLLDTTTTRNTTTCDARKQYCKEKKANAISKVSAEVTTIEYRQYIDGQLVDKFVEVSLRKIALMSKMMEELGLGVETDKSGERCIELRPDERTPTLEDVRTSMESMPHHNVSRCNEVPAPLATYLHLLVQTGESYGNIHRDNSSLSTGGHAVKSTGSSFYEDPFGEQRLRGDRNGDKGGNKRSETVSNLHGVEKLPVGYLSKTVDREFNNVESERAKKPIGKTNNLFGNKNWSEIYSSIKNSNGHNNDDEEQWLRELFRQSRNVTESAKGLATKTDRESRDVKSEESSGETLRQRDALDNNRDNLNGSSLTEQFNGRHDLTANKQGSNNLNTVGGVVPKDGARNDVPLKQVLTCDEQHMYQDSPINDATKMVKPYKDRDDNDSIYLEVPGVQYDIN